MKRNHEESTTFFPAVHAYCQSQLSPIQTQLRSLDNKKRIA